MTFYIQNPKNLLKIDQIIDQENFLGQNNQNCEFISNSLSVVSVNKKEYSGNLLINIDNFVNIKFNNKENLNDIFLKCLKDNVLASQVKILSYKNGILKLKTNVYARRILLGYIFFLKQDLINFADFKDLKEIKIIIDI